MTLMLLSIAREHSSRVPNKMLRPLGDTCLFRLLIEKFEEICKRRNPFDYIAIALSKKDKTLWDMAKSYNIEIEERNDVSVSQGDLLLSQTHHYLKDIPVDDVMFVNGCFPFLTIDTITNAAALFKEYEVIKSMTAVKKRYTWFWDIISKPINNRDPRCVSTKHSLPLLESVHCFHIFNRIHLLETDSYWNLKPPFDPFLYVLPESTEFLDVDTEYDFKLCEAIKKIGG